MSLAGLGQMMVKPKERVVRSVEATSETALHLHFLVPLGEALEGVYKSDQRQ